MRFIKVDLKRAFTEPTFFLSMGIGMMTAVISFFYIKYSGETAGEVLFQRAQALILPFFAPLLAAIPFSNMNQLEEDSGYQRLMMLGRTSKGVIYARFLTNMMIGAVTLAVPVCILYLLSIMTNVSESLRHFSFVLYYDALFGACYAALSYGLTFYCKKRYLPIIIPEVFYLLFTYAVPYLGITAYYPPLAFSPWLLPQVMRGRFDLITLGFIFVIAIMLLFLRPREFSRESARGLGKEWQL